jgi:hypothetical protein
MPSNASAATVRPQDNGVADPHPRLKEVANNSDGHRPPQPEKSREELSRELWAMTPAQRQAAMWAGELSGGQLMEWAKRAPKEVPLIENEFAFLAANTPEVAEALERSR